MNDAVPHLTGAERVKTHVNLRPKDAATLILLDQSGAVPKVLMGKRHMGHKFMPGKFVFPGGRSERADYAMNVAGALPTHVETRLMAEVARPSAAKARALALAAVRETFEETGLMLGTREFGAPDAAPAGPWAQFMAEGVFPNLENFHLIARAITPPKRPKRFDARFFCCDAGEIAHRIEGKVGPDAELTELVWMPLSQVRALDLPSITRIVLDELDKRLASRMAPYVPVPFFFERYGKWQRVEL